VSVGHLILVTPNFTQFIVNQLITEVKF